MRRQWQPTPVFLPGESQGWRNLVGCRLWGRTESDTTDATQQQQQQQAGLYKVFFICIQISLCGKMSLVTDLGITSATKAFQILTQTFDHGNLSLESSDEGKNDDV